MLTQLVCPKNTLQVNTILTVWLLFAVKQYELAKFDIAIANTQKGNF